MSKYSYNSSIINSSNFKFANLQILVKPAKFKKGYSSLSFYLANLSNNSFKFILLTLQHSSNFWFIFFKSRCSSLIAEIKFSISKTLYSFENLSNKYYISSYCIYYEMLYRYFWNSGKFIF